MPASGTNHSLFAYFLLLSHREPWQDSYGKAIELV
jgi:hypothetical protein